MDAIAGIQFNHLGGVALVLLILVILLAVNASGPRYK